MTIRIGGNTKLSAIHPFILAAKALFGQQRVITCDRGNARDVAGLSLENRKEKKRGI